MTVDSSPVTGVLRRGKLDMDTHVGKCHENSGGRDWSNAAMSQGIPSSASKHQELGRKRWERIPERNTRALNA